jgi:hypothetical protein
MLDLGNPVSASPILKHSSKLYRLACVPWKIERRFVHKPPGIDGTARSFLELSLPELLHFNGFNRPEVYRRPCRSYTDTMQPILDDYVIDNCFHFRLYGTARKYWKPSEAWQWNKQLQQTEGCDGGIVGSSPAPGSNDSVESGWEWRWQEDMVAAKQDLFRVGGHWKVGSEAFTAERGGFTEWVHLAGGSAVSTRCSFCTLMHGPPEPPEGCVRDRSMSRYRLPEDIAIGFAKIVALLRATVNGHPAIVRPADVVAVIEKVHPITVAIRGFPKSVGRGDILRIVGACDHSW